MRAKRRGKCGMPGEGRDSRRERLDHRSVLESIRDEGHQIGGRRWLPMDATCDHIVPVLKGPPNHAVGSPGSPFHHGSNGLQERCRPASWTSLSAICGITLALEKAARKQLRSAPLWSADTCLSHPTGTSVPDRHVPPLKPGLSSVVIAMAIPRNTQRPRDRFELQVADDTGAGDTTRPCDIARRRAGNASEETRESHPRDLGKPRTPSVKLPATCRHVTNARLEFANQLTSNAVDCASLATHLLLPPRPSAGGTTSPT